MKSFVFIFFLCVLFEPRLSGQCPDKSFLWHRIIYLRDSTKIAPKEQLAELLQYIEKIKSCPYQNDSTHALLLQRIGWLCSLQKDFVKAIRYSRQSLDIVYKNLDKPTVNYSHVIKTYNNLRIFYDSSGQSKLKQQATDSCIAIGLKLHKGYEYALMILPTRTYSYLESGDYYKCIEFSNLGEIVSKTETAYSYYLPYYLIWKVNALILLYKFDEAEQLLKVTINDFLKSGNDSFIGTFYGLLARLSEEREDEKNSLQYVNKSVSINEKTKQLTVSAQAINNLGYNLYFKRLKKYDLALFYYYKALKYADVKEALNIYENIANVYVQKKLFDSAFYFFQKSFDQIKTGIDETALLSEADRYVINNIDYVEYIMNLVLDKTDAYMEFYRSGNDLKTLSKAIGSYKIIDKIFDKIRLSQTEIQSKLFWRNSLRRLYEHAIEACNLQNNSTDAFYFFEKSRAVLLNDQLNEQQWTDQEDILKQSELRKKILAKEKELTGTDKASNLFNELKREIFIDQQDLTRVQDQIKEKNPLYYQNFVDSNFISIDNVRQNILKDYGALVELFAGDSAVYTLIITQQKSYFWKLNKIVFDSLSIDYISYISNADKLNKDPGSFFTISSRLYQLIFQNAGIPAGRTVISMDGRYFPFEALVTNMQPLNYFLEDHAVSYTYSARYLLNNFALNPATSSYKFVGIAPVRYSSGLPALPGSDQSLQRMKNYFPDATNFVGNQASRNNFLKEYYKYSIVQLYTHATDSGYTGEPMIYFSDSVLSLSDFYYEAKPSTSLIVLSACETAGGKLYNGEGVFSFNRQFAALGIPSAIANLWSVDNESTYKLTELFYKYLAKGLTSDVSLQKAKLEFIKTSSKEGSLPYYWAGPILAGKADKIELNKPVPWNWIIAVIVIAAVSFLLWKKRK